MSDLNTMINHIRKGDHVKANKVFNNIMGEKITTVLDTKKIEVASNMVTGRVEEPEVNAD